MRTPDDVDWSRSIYDCAVTSDEVTAYLNTLDEPKRATLQILREIILDVKPEFEQ